MADRQARFLEKIANPDEMLNEMVQRMCGIEGQYEGLPAICRAWDVPYGRVMAWLMADVERYAVYDRALAMQAKALVSETVTLADDGEDTARDKLRIDTRFRMASFHDRSTYGADKSGGTGGVTVVVNRGAYSGGSSGEPVAVSGDSAARAAQAVSISEDGRTLTVL